MPPEDTTRVRHMAEACEAIARLIAGKSRDSLNHEEALALALARSLEIVGEAAARLTSGTRERRPDIPWDKIIGMRNRLVHAYFDVNYDVLWRAVTVEVPLLLEQLRQISAGD